MFRSDAPLVSVVIPAYDSQRTIGEAIRSVLDQTLPTVEVIVVDDGSRDGTAGFVKETFGDRVRLVEAPHAGRSAARNTGLSLARGRYVQYLDADDVIAPTKLAQQTAFLEDHPEFAGAYGNVEAFSDLDPTRRWPFRPEIRPEGDVLPFMIEQGFLLTVGTLVGTDWSRRVGGFDPNLDGKEDWDHWLRIAAAGGRFARRPKDGYAGSYRVRSDTSRAPAPPVRQFRAGVTVLERLRRALGPTAARNLRVRRAIGHWRFGYGRSLLLTDRRTHGVVQMLRGLAEDHRDPAAKTAWIVLGALLGGTRAPGVIERIHPGAGGYAN